MTEVPDEQDGPPTDAEQDDLVDDFPTDDPDFVDRGDDTATFEAVPGTDA